MSEAYFVLHNTHGLDDWKVAKEGCKSQVQEWMDERNCPPGHYRVFRNECEVVETDERDCHRFYSTGICITKKAKQARRAKP